MTVAWFMSLDVAAQHLRERLSQKRAEYRQPGAKLEDSRQRRPGKANK